MNRIPDAYIVTVRGHGQRREFATLPNNLDNGESTGPGIVLSHDEELLNSIPLYKHADEHDLRVIEFAEYLANSVDQYMMDRNRHDILIDNDITSFDRLSQSADDLTESWNDMRNNVYEFRKRLANKK